MRIPGDDPRVVLHAGETAEESGAVDRRRRRVHRPFRYHRGRQWGRPDLDVPEGHVERVGSHFGWGEGKVVVSARFVLGDRHRDFVD